MREVKDLRVRFEGGPGWGYYEAYRVVEYTDGSKGGSLSDSIKVYRAEDGQWAAYYSGDPYSIAHPECRYLKNGSMVQECTCPRVDVPGTYRRRLDAARAGWAHKLVKGEYVHYERGYEGPPLSHIPVPPETVRLLSE